MADERMTWHDVIRELSEKGLEMQRQAKKMRERGREVQTMSDERRLPPGLNYVDLPPRSEAVRCPACGAEPPHLPGSPDCLRRQLAQAQERERTALVRGAELRRVVEAARKLAVAAEQVLKAWDMGDDVPDAIEELREAALDYAAVEAGEPEFEVEVIEIDDQLGAGAPRQSDFEGEKGDGET